MTVLMEKIYPDGMVYRGTAYKGVIEWGMLSFLDLNWLVVDVIEWNVRSNGGEMLYLKVEQKEDVQDPKYGLVHNYSSTFYFYPKTAEGAITFFPWAAIIILILLAIIAIAVYYALKESKEVIWGPGGESKLLPYAILIGAVGIASIGIGYAISKARQKPSK